SLIEESLFAASEKTGAARLGCAYAAGGRNAAAIEKGFRGSNDIQENLLAKNFGPDRLVPFEAIAIERVVPVRLSVRIFAALRIAAIIGLIERPAIGDDVINTGDGRQVFRREFRNVIRVGIETMAKFAIAAERRRCR